MRAERVENRGEIAELIRKAEPLARAHPAGIQMESWWLLPFLETIAQRPLAIVIRDGNDLLALGFFERRRSSLAIRGLLKKRVMTFLSQGPSDFSDILLIPTAKPEEIAGTFAGALRKIPRIDEIKLEQFPEPSAIARGLSDTLGFPLLDWVRVYSADLSVGYGALWQNAGRNARRDIHKKERKLLERFEITYDALREPGEAFLSEIVSLNRRRKDRRSPFLGERASFTLRMVRECQAAGRLLVFTMRANNRLISYRLGFARDGIFYDWNTSYDPELFDLSPGKVQLSHVLRWCVENGLSEFNFMRGDEDYKRVWSTGHTMNKALVFSLPTLRMRIASEWAKRRER